MCVDPAQARLARTGGRRAGAGDPWHSAALQTPYGRWQRPWCCAWHWRALESRWVWGDACVRAHSWDYGMQRVACQIGCPEGWCGGESQREEREGWGIRSRGQQRNVLWRRPPWMYVAYSAQQAERLAVPHVCFVAQGGRKAKKEQVALKRAPAAQERFVYCFVHYVRRASGGRGVQEGCGHGAELL